MSEEEHLLSGECSLTQKREYLNFNLGPPLENTGFAVWRISSDASRCDWGLKAVIFFRFVFGVM